MPIDPKLYSEAELEPLCAEAVEIFRRSRLEEPLESYLDSFDKAIPLIEDFLEQTIDLTQMNRLDLELLSGPGATEVLRTLAGPPISEDDLATLLGSKFSPHAIRKDPHLIRYAIETVLAALDKRRFPWVGNGRDPEHSEKLIAVFATAALIATRKTATARRRASKAEQEAKVEGALLTLNFTKVPRRDVINLSHAPGTGEFRPESKLGTSKADFLAGLGDGRLLALECKVSNSSLNSVKRVNREAAGKAENWRSTFGSANVVPAVMLGGVFQPRKLIEAQNVGLYLFWDHRIEEFAKWVESTF